MSAKAASRESRLWARQRPLAEAAVEFWTDFLGLSRLEGADEPLTPEDRDRLLAIVRVVSWSGPNTGPARPRRPRSIRCRSAVRSTVVAAAGVATEQPAEAHHRGSWPAELLGRRARRGGGRGARVPGGGAHAVDAAHRGTRQPRLHARHELCGGRGVDSRHERERGSANLRLWRSRCAAAAERRTGHARRSSTPDAQARHDEAWSALGFADVPQPRL